jgi:hypothetical protein
MRQLSPPFFKQLNGAQGMLRPLLDRVHADDTLDLEIRDDALDVYYRGGRLLHLGGPVRDFPVTFDENYSAAGRKLPALPAKLHDEADVSVLLDAFPLLKQLMDFHFAAHRCYEREYRQLIVRENNRAAMGKASDYFVCDLEYAAEMTVDGAKRRIRFDLVGAHWPSLAGERKRTGSRRLVVMEVKYGDGALKGPSGLQQHIDDVEEFFGNKKRVAAFKDEMCKVFNQKSQLGLLRSGKDKPKELTSFSSEKPLLLLVLADHDPDSTVLRTELETLRAPRNADLGIAMGNFMGYALFDPAILTLAELKAMTRLRV